MKLFIIVIFNIYSSCLYNFFKSITDSERDYPAQSKLYKFSSWLKHVSWNRWIHWEDISYFVDLWHWSEWMKEFTFWGCVFVNAFVPITNYIEFIIRGLSIIFTFWVGGEEFKLLYHRVWKINQSS